MKQLQQRIRHLGSLERHLKPDEAWVRATRESLLARICASSALSNTATSSPSAKSFIGYFIPVRLLGWVRGPLMAALSILLVALGGSVASVSAAENSLPGDLLYSLKLATEQARLAFTPAKDEKLKLKLEFNARRGEELKKVARVEGPSQQGRVERATEILKRDLKTVKEQLKEVKSQNAPNEVAQMAKLVDQKSQELVQTLQETKSDLSVKSKEKVTEAQAVAADTGVTAIEVLAEKHNESEDIVPKTEVLQAIQDHARIVAKVTGTVLPVSTSSSLAGLAATSTENSTSTAPTLEEAVEQVKVATQQAFAVQQDSAIDTTSSNLGTLPATTSSTSSTLPLLPPDQKGQSASSTSVTTSTILTSQTTSSSVTTSTPPK